MARPLSPPASTARLVRPLRLAGYRLLAVASFALGVIGVFLPLMPTTCFMLLALWAASRGSPRFAAWLRDHPRFGPPIRHWEEERAIPRRAKGLALAMLAVSMLLLGLAAGPLALRLALIAMLVALAAWIATRPAPRLG